MGEVIELSPTKPHAGDRPWWATATLVLVIVPGALAALGLLLLHITHKTVLATNQMIFARMLPWRKGPSETWRRERLKLAERFGKAVGRYLRGVFAREHTLLRVRADGRTIVCRAASPVGITGVSVGDQVELRGRWHADGILRVFELRNRSTGGRHAPCFIGPNVMVLGCVSLVLVVMFIADLSRSAH